MHDMRELQHIHISLHLHGSYLTYPADIVTSQVNEHIMLRFLLIIIKQVFYQSLILFIISPSPSGARKRECVKDTVLQFDKRLRRSTCDFNIISREVEHIRRRVHGAQHPVCIQKASGIVSIHPVAEYHLEYIPFMYMVLGLLHHIAEPLLIKESTEFGS